MSTVLDNQPVVSAGACRKKTKSELESRLWQQTHDRKLFHAEKEPATKKAHVLAEKYGSVSVCLQNACASARAANVETWKAKDFCKSCVEEVQSFFPNPRRSMQQQTNC
jgi:hypothetical protein